MLPYNLRKQCLLLCPFALLRHRDNTKSKTCSLSSHSMHKDMHICMCEFVGLAYSIMTYIETLRNTDNIAHIGYIIRALKRV